MTKQRPLRHDRTRLGMAPWTTMWSSPTVRSPSPVGDDLGFESPPMTSTRIRRHPNYPSPSSPYYRFGFQPPNYAFNWSGGQGGVPPNNPRARGLNGLGHTAYSHVGDCFPMGNADLLESDGFFRYPAFNRTALHQIPQSMVHQPPTRLAQPWPRATYEPTGSFIVPAVRQAAYITAWREASRQAAKTNYVDTSSGHKGPDTINGMGDWPLVLKAGPERLTYGEMGAIPIWDGLSDNEKIVAVGAAAIGGYFLWKKMKRRNPSRARRRRRRRR